MTNDAALRLTVKTLGKLARPTAATKADPAATRKTGPVLRHLAMLAALTLAPQAHAVAADDALLSAQCRAIVGSQKTAVLPWIADGATPGSAMALAHAQRALLAAATHGLDPADYGIDQLIPAARALQNSGNSAAIAPFNEAMTRATVCYLHQVKRGHVDAQTLYPKLDVTRADWSAATALRTAFADGTVPALLATAPPQTLEYEQLRALLEDYRSRADVERVLGNQRLAFIAPLQPGDEHDAVASLRARLVFLGDMTEFDRLTAQERDFAARNDTAAEANVSAATASAGLIVQTTTPPVADLAAVYDALTVAAVMRFQRRHGLDDTGIVDAQTVEQLGVPMHQRVASIELALERVRWMPDMRDAAWIHVNMPSFSLQASNALAAASNLASLDSRVVIGKSERSPTPIYTGEVSRIEFNPYWFVPSSIARRDIVPKLRRNPAYMTHQGMEITYAGKTYRQATTALINALAKGQASIRQRPGPRNALGQIKFVLPNARSIYLHDTSAPEYFSHIQRDFSNGCVRVEKPIELAQVILAADPAWTHDRIEQILRRDRTVIATPAQSVKVAFTYQTVTVDPAGRPSFLPDVYQHDALAIRTVARWRGMDADNVNATARNDAVLPVIADIAAR